MIKQYFKQAWQLVKQNKLFSLIYVAGTALSISMVMFVAIFFFLRSRSYYPEQERDKLFHIQHIALTPKDTTIDNYHSSLLSHRFVKEVVYSLKTPKAVSASIKEFKSSYQIKMGDGIADQKVSVKYTDPGFWEVYRYKFVEGKPFSQADFESGLPSAVIAKGLADKLFPDTQATGQHFVMNGKDYRVSGVVEDGSYLLESSFGVVFLPYTIVPGYEKADDDEDVLGFFTTVIRLNKSSDEKAMRDEIKEKVAQLEAPLTHNIHLDGQPESALVHSFRRGNRGADMKDIMLKTSIILLLVLLVPAINLSGLNSSQMEERLREIGVRKAFGAPNGVLLRQVLIENFLLTLLGALLGLLVSYFLILYFSDMLIGRLSLYASDLETLTWGNKGITPSMLFDPFVFVITVFFALVVNVLSGLVPAYHFTKKSITYSLNDNPTNHY